MITITRGNPSYNVPWELRGLSSDPKPTEDKVPNGSSFLEMDTGSVYFWDKANEQWRAM